MIAVDFDGFFVVDHDEKFLGLDVRQPRRSIGEGYFIPINPTEIIPRSTEDISIVAARKKDGNRLGGIERGPLIAVVFVAVPWLRLESNVGALDRDGVLHLDRRAHIIAALRIGFVEHRLHIGGGYSARQTGKVGRIKIPPAHLSVQRFYLRRAQQHSIAVRAQPILRRRPLASDLDHRRQNRHAHHQHHPHRQYYFSQCYHPFHRRQSIHRNTSCTSTSKSSNSVTLILNFAAARSSSVKFSHSTGL